MYDMIDIDLFLFVWVRVKFEIIQVFVNLQLEVIVLVLKSMGNIQLFYSILLSRDKYFSANDALQFMI